MGVRAFVVNHTGQYHCDYFHDKPYLGELAVDCKMNRCCLRHSVMVGYYLRLSGKGQLGWHVSGMQQ